MGRYDKIAPKLVPVPDGVPWHTSSWERLLTKWWGANDQESMAGEDTRRLPRVARAASPGDRQGDRGAPNDSLRPV